MRHVAVAVVCERVRVQVSLELDGELSMLEKKMLEKHLSTCAACRGYAADVREFTAELRAIPLEPIGRPVVVRRLRRMVFHRAQAGLAAAVVLALAASMLYSGWSADPSSSSLTMPTRFPTLNDGRQEARQAAIDGRAFEHHRGSVLAI